MIVKVEDLRALEYCASGTKQFFERHNLNWREFVITGIDENELLNTGDAMAKKVVEAAHERRKQ